MEELPKLSRYFTVFLCFTVFTTTVNTVRPQKMSYFHIGLYYCHFFVNVLRGTDFEFSGPFDYDLATFCTSSR